MRPAGARRASDRPPSSPGSSRRRATRASCAERLGIPGPAYRRFDSAEPAIEWFRVGRPPGRRQARRVGGRQGRHRARRRRRDRSPRSGPPPTQGPFVRRGTSLRSGVLAARALRRPDRAATADRPGPQAHRRGRHRAEHRRDGCLRAGAGAVRRRRAGGDVRAAGARPPRRRRHAVRRRAVRGVDADRRRAAADRVQLPVRRPRGAGRAPPRRIRPRRAVAGVHARRARHGFLAWCEAAPRARWSLPRLDIRSLRSPAPRSAGSRPTEDASTIVFPAGIADGRVTGGRVLAVTGLGADLAAARGRRVRADGVDPVRRDAGASRHRLAGSGRDARRRTRRPASTSTRATVRSAR